MPYQLFACTHESNCSRVLCKAQLATIPTPYFCAFYAAPPPIYPLRVNVTLHFLPDNKKALVLAGCWLCSGRQRLDEARCRCWTGLFLPSCTVCRSRRASARQYSSPKCGWIIFPLRFAPTCYYYCPPPICSFSTPTGTKGWLHEHMLLQKKTPAREMLASPASTFLAATFNLRVGHGRGGTIPTARPLDALVLRPSSW